MEGICNTLESDDRESFLCHKTVHSKIGGEWIDDGDEEGDAYRPSGKESHCMGAAIYLYKRGKISVPTRLALALGLIEIDDLDSQVDLIVDDCSENPGSA